MKYLIALLALIGPLQAAYTLKNGKFINTREVATMSVQEHYSAAQEAFEKANWEECLHQSIVIQKNFPSSPFYHETIFLSAVSYFHLKDYDFANDLLSEYLKLEASSKHFEEAISYKFKIAEQFQIGVKKHVLGQDALPKWMPAKSDAIEIFDEVIAALPHHDLGAKALYGKAKLLFEEKLYQDSIETLQGLIRRFPKHELAPESYLLIGKIYYSQCKNDYPDPDLLDLSDINLKKFEQDFPTETRIETAKVFHRDMQEVFAQNLFETGRFFERTKKPSAAVIYYSKIISKYPETNTAKQCENRLVVMKRKKLEPKKEIVEAQAEVIEGQVAVDEIKDAEEKVE